MDFEVVPATLRRAGADLGALADQLRAELTRSYHSVAPDRAANVGWSTTDRTDTAVATADRTLTGSAGRCRDLGDALTSAATAYERADERAARRPPW